jgi:hypothetical protein
MAPRKKLPGVDKDALAGLAKQFPGSQDPSSQDDQAAPEAADKAAQREAGAEAPASTPVPSGAPLNAPAAKSKSKATVGARPKADPARAKTRSKAAASAPKSESAAVPEPSPPAKAPEPASTPPLPSTPPPAPRRGGWALVSVALLISLFALAFALAALSPPQLQSWLRAGIDYPPLVDFLTGTKTGIDARLRKDAAAIQSAESGLAAHDARLGAIEAVGGSNEAAARRVDAVEALATASERNVRALDTQVSALAGRLDAAAKQNADADRRLVALEAQLPGRLTEIEAGLGALKRSSSGPAKIYLIALGLRVAVQSAEPFADEVEAAATVGGTGPRIAAALEVLARHASNGVATRGQLWDRFQRRLAPRLRAYDSAAGRSAFVQFRGWFNSLFLDGAGTPMAAANAAAIGVLAAENMARGQLRPASEQLARLEGAFAAAAAPWLSDARARIAVDAATASLMAEAFDRFIAADD